MALLFNILNRFARLSIRQWIRGSGQWALGRGVSAEEPWAVDDGVWAVGKGIFTLRAHVPRIRQLGLLEPLTSQLGTGGPALEKKREYGTPDIGTKRETLCVNDLNFVNFDNFDSRDF